MIDSITGKLEWLGDTYVVLNAGGVGYRIDVPLGALCELPSVGASATLYTAPIYRETEQILFGFLERTERDFFLRLCGVSGIGPKMALALLSKFSLSQLIEAISSQKISLLSQAPGIGKKSAERLALELRDRLPALSSTPSSSLHSDAVQALMHLGYAEARASNAVEAALTRDPKLALSALIREALQCV